MVVYGDAGLTKSHPVIEYLSTEGRCASLQYYKEGFAQLEKQYGFLCTASVRANSIKR